MCIMNGAVAGDLPTRMVPIRFSLMLLLHPTNLVSTIWDGIKNKRLAVYIIAAVRW